MLLKSIKNVTNKRIKFCLSLINFLKFSFNPKIIGIKNNNKDVLEQKEEKIYLLKMI